MATNKICTEVAKLIKGLDAESEQQLKKLNEDELGIIAWVDEITKILQKELVKVKRLAKAKRAGGLESLRQRLPDIIEEKSNYSRNSQSIREATIIVDKTIEINNGNETLNSTLTTKRSSRLAMKKTMSIIKTRRQKDEEDRMSMSVKKRSMEDEVDVTKSNCKRAKLKSEVDIEIEVFKKPKPLRGRRKREDEKSVVDLIDDRTIGDEESFFSSSVLHSSPKADVPSSSRESPKPSTTVVQVKTPSVKETVAAFERLGSEVGSGSTPRKNLLKELISKNLDLSKNSVDKKQNKVEVMNEKESTPKSQDSQDEDVITDTDDECKTVKKPAMNKKKSVSLFGSEEKKAPKGKKAPEEEKVLEENLNVTRTLNPPVTNLNLTQTLSTKAPTAEGKQENLNVTRTLNPPVTNLNLTQTLSTKAPTPEGKQENLNLTRTLNPPVTNLNLTQTLSTKAPTPEGKQKNLNVTRNLRSKLPSPEAMLDKTQTIPVASKRTKPVLKSKIFDSAGNNMLSDCKAPEKEPVFLAPAPVPIESKPPSRKSTRLQQSDSETENSKSDSELSKGKKRISSELSEPEPEPEPKAKKKSVNKKPRKNSQAHSDGEAELPKRKATLKAVKNEVISPDNVKEEEKSMREPDPEPEPAPRPKRTRTVRQAAVKEDAESEVPVPKPSKRTKPAKVKDDEFQEEPIRSTRTKTLKTAQMNTIEEVKLPNISVASTTRQSTDSSRKSDIENQSPVPAKKRTKMNKKKEVNEENVIMPEEGGRITRTKSKAVKQQNAEETQKRNSSVTMAKKSLNKAKLIALQKCQLEKLVPKVCVTPEKGFSNYLTNTAKLKLLSTSKNQVLMNSTNKLQTMGTPMSGFFSKFPQPISSTNKKIDNSSTGKGKWMFHAPQSVSKEGSSRKPTRSTNSSVDSAVKSVTKIPRNDDLLEKEMKLLSKKEKEDEAKWKREQALRNRQEELKKKNEMKIKMVSKQKERIELEKHKNIIQSEKEKDEKHKLILEERKMKLKEEAMRKKMITKQKANEVEERRRLEEEARLAKIREQEAEQQRIQLEKQKEIERNEKRAQERAAEKKKREEFEQKQREELAREKAAAAAKKALALQSANKQKRILLCAVRKDWNYKPRNENDYGLEDENSEVDSGDEEPEKPDKPYPAWAKAVMDKKHKLLNAAQLEVMTTFMACYKKTPDVDRMFKMTPSKRIKRTSSAIWNTPSS